MTIIEAINRVDDVKPNNYSIADKVRWLATLDGRIKTDIIDTHEGGDDVGCLTYEAENTSTELIVKAPYDEMYVRYLESQIDYANNEYGKYNNSSAAFNTIFSDFAKKYNREHMPKGTKIKFA